MKKEMVRTKEKDSLVSRLDLTTEKERWRSTPSFLLAVCAVAFVLSSCGCDRDTHCCEPCRYYDSKPKTCPKRHWDDPCGCDPVNYSI